ncbi:MAG: response regulator transcription factor, partial [Kineosporiaceae bacterium]
TQAREIAERLRAVPLVRRLDPLLPSRAGDGAAAPSVLTPREAQVLALLAEGYSNGEIGKRLFISTKTASVHVSSILAKLGASGRTEAAAVARRRGLLDH